LFEQQKLNSESNTKTILSLFPSLLS